MRIKSSVLIATLFVTLVVPVVSAQGANGNGPQNSNSNRPETVAEARILPVREASSSAPVRSNVGLEKRESVREMVAQKRMEALSTSQIKREALKEKLQSISDTQKVAVVERIDNKLIEINNKSTDRWLAALEKMTGMLDRASSQAAELEASGANTTALEAAITEAEASITEAKTAVTEQSGKSYVATITTETALRTNVGSTVSLLRVDLRATHASVIVAKQSLVQVIRALAAVKAVEEESDSVSTDSADVAL